MEASNINLNLIKYFIVAAESESLAEAGEKLGYSASTVSTSITTLEEQLGGIKLLTRKPLKLTEMGQQIYDTMKDGIARVDFANVIAKSKNNIECGKISIGCPSHITEFFLMEQIAKAIEDNPNLEIKLNTEADSKTLIEMMKNNKIDFAILDLIPEEYIEELEIKELKSSENIFISKEEIQIKDIKELNNYKFILSYENKASTRRLLEILNNYDIKLETALRCPTTEPRVLAARLGIGIAYVMKEAAKKALDNREIYEVKVPIELPKSSIKIVYLKNHLTKVDKEFIKKYLK